MIKEELDRITDNIKWLSKGTDIESSCITLIVEVYRLQKENEDLRKELAINEYTGG
jgi:hypothetical protein